MVSLSSPFFVQFCKSRPSSPILRMQKKHTFWPSESAWINLVALSEIFNFNSDPKDFIWPPRPGRMRVGRRARDKGFPWLVTCHHSRSVLWTQNVFENNGRRKLADWALLQNPTLLTECIFGDGFPKHGNAKLRKIRNTICSLDPECLWKQWPTKTGRLGPFAKFNTINRMHFRRWVSKAWVSKTGKPSKKLRSAATLA